MYSLNSYKEQVYNLGSPQPNPSRSPLKSLPKNDNIDSFEFPSPAIKAPQTPSRNLKRKCVTSQLTDSPKKLKTMTPQQMKEMFSGLESTLAKLNEKMDNFSKKLDAQDEKHEEVNKNVNDMKETFANFKDTIENNNKVLEEKMNLMESEFVKLHDKVDNCVSKASEEVKATVIPVIHEEIVPTLKTEIKSELLKSVDGTWKAQLAEKVKEHEKSAIVFGFPVSKNAFDDAIEFIENNLKLDRKSIENILLTGADRLGKGSPNKPPPLLMYFSSHIDRNLVLSFSKNLRNSKISIEKHVPKVYQAEYKKFKSTAAKLRLLPEMNYQTQITFDSHLMLLRYKARDTPNQKFQYITHSEYYPPMSQASSGLKSSLHIPPGTVPTPVISAATTSKANNSFIMTGMISERTEDMFVRQFTAHVKEEDRASILEIKLLKRNTAVIYCKSWDDCKRIVNGIKEAKFENEKVYYSLFAEEKPNDS